MPAHAVQTLVTVAKSLAETELDPNASPTGYLKSYCEIRANCMIKSLSPLHQSSMVELKGVYDKGSTPFIPYTTSLLKLCRVCMNVHASLVFSLEKSQQDLHLFPLSFTLERS